MGCGRVVGGGRPLSLAPPSLLRIQWPIVSQGADDHRDDLHPPHVPGGSLRDELPALPGARLAMGLLDLLERVGRDSGGNDRVARRSPMDLRSSSRAFKKAAGVPPATGQGPQGRRGPARPRGETCRLPESGPVVDRFPFMAQNNKRCRRGQEAGERPPAAARHHEGRAQHGLLHLGPHRELLEAEGREGRVAAQEPSIAQPKALVTGVRTGLPSRTASSARRSCRLA